MSRRSRLAGVCVVYLALSVPAAWAQPARELGADEADITATGQGAARAGLAPAQARLMAERAARVVATRNLARKVFGQEVQLDETGSGTGALEVFLKGVRQVSSTPLEGGQYEVTVGIPLREVGKTVTGIWEENRALRGQNAELRASLAGIQAQLQAVQAELAKARLAAKGLTEDNARLTEMANQTEARLRAARRELREARARIAELESAQTRPAGS